MPSEVRKLFTFNRCWCFSLETGGIICVCLIMISDFFVLLASAARIKNFWGAPCEDFERDAMFSNFASNIFIDECESVKTASWILLFSRLTLFALELVFMILAFIGIKKRNHKLLVPAIIYEIIGQIIYLVFQSLQFSKVVLGFMIITTIFAILLVLVLISLYLNFRDERAEYAQAKQTAE